MLNTGADIFGDVAVTVSEEFMVKTSCSNCVFLYCSQALVDEVVETKIFDKLLLVIRVVKCQDVHTYITFQNRIV